MLAYVFAGLVVQNLFSSYPFAQDDNQDSPSSDNSALAINMSCTLLSPVLGREGGFYALAWVSIRMTSAMVNVPSPSMSAAANC